MSSASWPANVPARRRRPAERPLSPTLVGALAGAAIGKTWQTAAIGGAAGLLLSNDVQKELSTAIRDELAAKGLRLISMTRTSPYALLIVVEKKGRYFSVKSQAPDESLSAADRDDWLFGDILDFQIPVLLAPAAERA